METVLLTITRGSSPGACHRLTRFPISLGRLESNDVVIDERGVSGQHLRIKRRDRLFIVEDLDSHNGTYLNGDRIRNSIIREGDRLLVGNTEIVFQLAAAEGPFSESASKSDQIAMESDVEGTAVFKVAGPENSIVRLLDGVLNVLSASEIKDATKTILKSLQVTEPAPVAARMIEVRRGVVKSQSVIASLDDNLQMDEGTHLLMTECLRRRNTVLGEVPKFETGVLQRMAAIPLLLTDGLSLVLCAEWGPMPKHTWEALLPAVRLIAKLCMSHFEALNARKNSSRMFMGYAKSILAVLKAKDTYTAGHSERVARYTWSMAKCMRLDGPTTSNLVVSALCHDIGKVGVSELVLRKPGLLSTDEFEEMKLHPTLGRDIVNAFPGSASFITGVVHHHERWDGTGYPEGLEGEDIPFFARIIAIADAFDAMVSGRSYSGFFEEGQAVERLVTLHDLFDPEILKVFADAYASGALTLRTETSRGADPVSFGEIVADDKAS